MAKIDAKVLRALGRGSRRAITSMALMRCPPFFAIASLAEGMSIGSLAEMQRETGAVKG